MIVAVRLAGLLTILAVCVVALDWLTDPKRRGR